jgi:hypothetical protein
MKTDRYNLEGLLADVEHAGRDVFRQQELGAMIDRMAGESEKHGFWWWGARVAAAACVLFFIGTAVRVWFMPTGESTTVVAETEVPKVVLTAEPETVVEAKPVVHRGRVKTVAMQPVVAEPAEPVVVEEYLVEEIVEEELPVEEQVEAPVENQIEMIAQPEVSIAQTVESTHEETAPAVKPRERKRNFLGSLIRPAEPSLMEGTTLALLEF